MLDRIASLLRIAPPILEDEGLLLSSGPTIPTDGTLGYQTGCLFQHTDGAAATALYINVGTYASCDFNAVVALTVTEAGLLGATAGTATASKAVILDANKDVGDFRNIGASGAMTLKGGAATPAVVARIGASATEGLEVKVYDEIIAITNAVTTNTTCAIPAGAVILSAQVNLVKTVVGDTSGDNLLARVGLGITGTVVKYGVSADLVKNTKIDTLPAWAVNAGETLAVYAVKADGSTAATEKFVASGAAVRVRVVYLVPNSLDDAA